VISACLCLVATAFRARLRQAGRDGPAVRAQTGGHVAKSSMNLAVLRFSVHGTRPAASGWYRRCDRCMYSRPSDRRVFQRVSNPWKCYVAGFYCSPRKQAGHSASSAWRPGWRSTSGWPARRGTIWSASQHSKLSRRRLARRTSWSPDHISSWRRALSEPASAPLAVLRIPKIRLEVPVLPGTDDRTLGRAVGHIEDTARPGTRQLGPRRAPGRLLPGAEGHHSG
jgi:hypothetical protein